MDEFGGTEDPGLDEVEDQRDKCPPQVTTRVDGRKRTPPPLLGKAFGGFGFATQQSEECKWEPGGAASAVSSGFSLHGSQEEHALSCPPALGRSESVSGLTRQCTATSYQPSRWHGQKDVGSKRTQGGTRSASTLVHHAQSKSSDSALRFSPACRWSGSVQVEHFAALLEEVSEALEALSDKISSALEDFTAATIMGEEDE